jgi:hypothetical protein
MNELGGLTHFARVRRAGWSCGLAASRHNRLRAQSGARKREHASRQSYLKAQELLPCGKGEDRRPPSHGVSLRSYGKHVLTG